MIRRPLNPVLLGALATMSLGVGPTPEPLNDLWPVRSHEAIRRGCYVLEVSAWARADWARAGLPRVGPSGGPREAFDPLWDELVNWLSQCPVLTDIETFWVFDADLGHGWQLLVTGIAAKTSVAVRVPTGTITYDEAPSASLDVPDHEYVEVQIELSPEDAAKIQRERATLSAGYAIRQQPLVVNYVSRMPDDSLETVVDGRVICGYAGMGEMVKQCLEQAEAEPVPDTVLLPVKRWDEFASIIYRRDKQAKKQRRAARKRKRGWA